MRKFDLLKSLLFLLLLGGSFWGQRAQGQILYGSSPFQDSLWGIDTTTWNVVYRMGPTLSGFTITGMTGMAWDPVGHDTYIIMKVSGVSGRVLGKIDLNTGVCTQVGNLGNNFSTINFRADGQLFGVTGNGASTNPETLFTIDKNTGVPTLAMALGNGADGEIISYNFSDSMFYHWSGNGTIVFEKFPATAPYTPVTNIPTIGTTHGETFGALYLNNGTFLVSNISSSFEHVGANGQYGVTMGSNPDDLRGVVMVPTFSMAADTVCVRDTVSFALSNGSMARDTAVYDWGDGNVTTVYPAAGASHTYSTGGNYIAHAILKNDTVGLDTIFSKNLRVNALPVVVLTPGNDTILCFDDSLNVTGTSGGTLQWLMNGAPIVGETGSSYTVVSNGWYNQVKTNQNGCTDSAAVGIMVTFGDQPDASLGTDSTLCEGDTICFTLTNPVGVTYLWSDGNTTASDCFVAGGAGQSDLSVMATDPVGCVDADTVTFTVIGTVSASVTVDTSNCPTIVFTDNDPNATSWAWNFGDGNTGVGNPVTHTYTANGSYNGTVVASNQCFSDTDNGTIDISCIVGVGESFGNGITVSPNPSTGTFLLNAELSTAGPLQYRIIDLNGRKLLDWSNEDIRSNWTERVNLGAAPGVYFLTVISGTERAVYRIVIQ